MRKKLVIFACICLAAFAGQMCPNANQLTFVLQIPTYHKTQKDLLNSVAAALAGWVAGPFLILPLTAFFGRSSVVLYSLIGVFICQIWAGEMTGLDDFIPFTISRLFAGFFGPIPAILGSGYIIDMFCLHQRGKAFAIFEVLIIFAVVGGGTLGGFIAQPPRWDYVFWWTLGPVGAAIICVFLFVEDTEYDRNSTDPRRHALPKSWVANRMATFLPGIKTQPAGKASEFVGLPSIPRLLSVLLDIPLIFNPSDPTHHRSLSNILRPHHPPRWHLYLHRSWPPHNASLHASCLPRTSLRPRRLWLLF